MSFKLYIYYSTLLGAWAALLAGVIAQFSGIRSMQQVVLGAALTGALLGLLVAGAVGFVDAVFNSVGMQRFVRAGLCMLIGLVGGALGGFIGQALQNFAANRESLHKISDLGILMVVGWILTGVCIGASVGVFDVLRAVMTGGALRVPIKKTLNGIYGGFVGGLIGGVPYAFLAGNQSIPRSSLALGLLVLGLSVGLLIGLAQVILKEAWLKIERGPRAGREVMLTKDEITIGRGEGCDVGIFGDMDIDKKHARILLEQGRYILEDENSVRGTFVNDRRISKPAELVSGDLIRVGSCYLRFGERTKRE